MNYMLNLYWLKLNFLENISELHTVLLNLLCSIHPYLSFSYFSYPFCLHSLGIKSGGLLVSCDHMLRFYLEKVSVYCSAGYIGCCPD